MSSAPNVVRDALADAAIHEQWVSMYRTPEAQGFYEVAFDAIARELSAPAGSTILDAGCGSCAKSVLLAARGFHVVATDFSQNALDLAKKTIHARGLDDKITLRQGDLLRLPFEDGQFKYAVCWGVLMHVPELHRALSELTRVLAPGGKLVLSEGNMYSAQSIALRGLKRILGKGRARVERVPAGLESHEATPQGTLLTRQLDMKWFVAECDRLGLALKTRRSGQFTEMYALMPWRPVRRAIHAANDVWFRFVRLPGPAFGNLLVFEKKQPRSAR
ncbi:MAG TPA: class I SAM-dependent methyltransferase [Vicinamibacterales bacterium]|jgi:ubiquinone/menaquinone biosynthesis C-methylase UbiE